MKKILTIQDISCYGSCSSTVALPILEHYGVEAAILPSAILSTHTGGFKNNTYLDLTNEMKKIVNNWNNEKISFDSLYTGFIASTKQFDIIYDVINKLIKGPIYVDPAMADNGHLYKSLDKNTISYMKELIKKADIIFPNITEACFLLNKEYKDRFSLDELKTMAIELTILGTKISIITGVGINDLETGALAYDKIENKFYHSSIKRLNKSYHGTGDLFASLVISYLLNNINLDKALSLATKFVYDSIEATLNDNNHNYSTKFVQILARESLLAIK